MEGDVSGVGVCKENVKNIQWLFEIYFGKFDIQIMETFKKNGDLGGLHVGYMLDYHFKDCKND